MDFIENQQGVILSVAKNPFSVFHFKTEREILHYAQNDMVARSTTESTA